MVLGAVQVLNLQLIRTHTIVCMHLPPFLRYAPRYHHHFRTTACACGTIDNAANYDHISLCGTGERLHSQVIASATPLVETAHVSCRWCTVRLLRCIVVEPSCNL